MVNEAMVLEVIEVVVKPVVVEVVVEGEEAVDSAKIEHQF